jgi:DNA polymerase III delta prime subunit
MRYEPKCAADFIGPARQWAEWIETTHIPACRASGSPVKLLLMGDPGIGKSALANHVVRLLGGVPGQFLRLSGTQVKMEIMDDLARQMRIGTLFSEFTILQIEEADAVPDVAQTRLLTLIDDLGAKTAVICTSNCAPGQLNPRFQTRFCNIVLKAPPVEEISALLVRLGIGKPAATTIAGMSLGNVRHALGEADKAPLMRMAA